MANDKITVLVGIEMDPDTQEAIRIIVREEIAAAQEAERQAWLKRVGDSTIPKKDIAAITATGTLAAQGGAAPAGQPQFSGELHAATMEFSSSLARPE